MSDSDAKLPAATRRVLLAEARATMGIAEPAAKTAESVVNERTTARRHKSQQTQATLALARDTLRLARERAATGQFQAAAVPVTSSAPAPDVFSEEIAQAVSTSAVRRAQVAELPGPAPASASRFSAEIPRWSRFIIVAIGVVLLGVAFVRVACPPRTGVVMASISEVLAPIAGRCEPVSIVRGSRVPRGTVVARVRPDDGSLAIDVRSASQAVVTTDEGIVLDVLCPPGSAVAAGAPLVRLGGVVPSVVLDQSFAAGSTALIRLPGGERVVGTALAQAPAGILVAQGTAIELDRRLDPTSAVGVRVRAIIVPTWPGGVWLARLAERLW